MRVLYVSSSNVVGGGSIALLNLVRGVMAAGHDVMVATTCDNGAFYDMLAETGCRLVRCHHRLSVYPTRGSRWQYLPRLVKMVLDNRRGRKELARVIRDFQPDIVHTNVGPMDAAFDACRQLGVKHVWHQREYQDLDFGLRFYPNVKTFMRKSHAEGNYNICITKGVYAHRQFRDGIDTVIYDGVFPSELCDQSRWQAKEDYVLFAGRIEEAKGALDLLHVFAEFHKRYPTCRLKLAGRYDAQSAYYQRCLDFVQSARLTDAVELMGERSDVYELMARARMLVVPSRFEGFGFITAEAMLNGCPVVGRDTAGTKEQFDKGLEYTGREIALRFTTDEEMLSMMCRVMDEPMEDMCQGAFRTVSHFYTIEEHVRQVLGYYERIINNR